MVKLWINKEKILKAAREKQLIQQKRSLVRLGADFSSEAMMSRR